LIDAIKFLYFGSYKGELSMGHKTARYKCVFTGRVQGVGFRYRTTRMVGRYPEITGTVQNRSDGGVALVVEGSRREILAVLEEIGTELGCYITSEKGSWGSGERHFADFRVIF
jgi:acylphosphatase